MHRAAFSRNRGTDRAVGNISNRSKVKIAGTHIQFKLHALRDPQLASTHRQRHQLSHYPLSSSRGLVTAARALSKSHDLATDLTPSPFPHREGEQILPSPGRRGVGGRGRYQL
jgi:hypothetical protein